MQTLKFLGRGSAFNTAEGNTSAYHIIDNTLILFDCGETVFHTLIKNNKLSNLIKKHNIEDIYVHITHLHSDHVSSLSSLIYYCYFVLGMKIKVHYPNIKRCKKGYSSTLIDLLTIHGHNNEQYEFKTNSNRYVFSHPALHTDELKSYSYTIILDELGCRKAFYSGDCCELRVPTILNINNGFYDEIYLECAVNKSNVHMDFEYLNSVIKPEIRDRVYLMHIDNMDKAKELANKYNFKIVELDK